MTVAVAARPKDDADRPWIEALLRDHWGGEMQIGHGEAFYPADHEGSSRSMRPVRSG